MASKDDTKKRADQEKLSQLYVSQILLHIQSLQKCGEIYQKLGEFSKAIEYFSKA